MPRRSSVGWFGCKREDSRPGRPIVLREFSSPPGICGQRKSDPGCASVLRLPATISGVSPGASRAKCGAIGLVGKQPVAQAADGEMRDGFERHCIVVVENQPGDFVLRVAGSAALRRKMLNGRSASTALAATRWVSPLRRQPRPAHRRSAGPRRRPEPASDRRSDKWPREKLCAKFAMPPCKHGGFTAAQHNFTGRSRFGAT